MLTYRPSPLFDGITEIKNWLDTIQKGGAKSALLPFIKNCLHNTIPFHNDAIKDYHAALLFLYSYRGSKDTFNAYRREIERFLQWSWFIRQCSCRTLTRLDLEAFIEFCQKPRKSWIATKTVSRFVHKNGIRVANKEWRPFVAKISKKAFADGEQSTKADFMLSQPAIKIIFGVLGSFYQFLIQEDLTKSNPVAQIRQKSKFIQNNDSVHTIRRLSDQQWKMVLEAAEDMAKIAPDKHERTLFIINALFQMYLRISELGSKLHGTPTMSSFFRDDDGNWWFKTVGKGNKARQVTVSSIMLAALKRWRKHLGTTLLPSPDDNSSLIPKTLGKGAVSSTRTINYLVQHCFDLAVQKLKKNNENEEAELLRSATVHWLRHTGISEDVKVRPREHVRDDAGHSSGAITDRYIDVELKARARSAQKKR